MYMSLHTNIERVLSLATDDEIADGLSAYRMQHGIARVLHRVYDLPSVEHAAGVIAALSPLNGWDDNVSDAFAVCQWAKEARASELTTQLSLATLSVKVRTTFLHRNRALSIALCGSHPEQVLVGRKTTTFYRLTAAPEVGVGVAVDRHLAAIAVGRALDDHETTALLARRYEEIERAYAEVGHAHGVLAWQAASVCWYAWRRMKRGRRIGQRLMRGGADE